MGSTCASFEKKIPIAFKRRIWDRQCHPLGIVISLPTTHHYFQDDNILGLCGFVEQVRQIHHKIFNLRHHFLRGSYR